MVWTQSQTHTHAQNFEKCTVTLEFDIFDQII